MDEIKKLAMPRDTTKLSNAQVKRAERLLKSNYEIKEVADMLGVSPSFIYNSVDVASIRHSAIEERLGKA